MNRTPPHSRHPFVRWTSGALGIAAAYWLAGRVGLMLAIPPGYATAVWPASGIALAALLLLGSRYAFGVFLGSFLVNISTSLDTSGPAALTRSVLLAVGIGVGAALQAVLGAALARRFKAYPDTLGEEGRIIRFMVLGGPVGCLFNATWGIGLLFLAGRLHGGLVLSNWWTWWVGDSIGVMIFAPLILLWADRSQMSWRRQVVVSVPLAVTFAAVVSLFIHSSRSEHERIRGEFVNAAQDMANDLQEDLLRKEEGLYAIEGFFAGSQAVDRGEFRNFTERFLARRPDLQAMSWNQVVPAAARRSFEAGLRREGFRGAVIREKEGGALVTAERRDEYVPVTYIEPLEKNRSVVGYDVASSVLRREAMLRSLATRRAVATAPVNLLQSEGVNRGILVFLPIFKNPGAIKPEGYAVSIFVLRNMLSPVLNAHASREVFVSLFDDAALPDRRLLHGAMSPQEQFSLDIPLTMADRTWRLHVAASPAYFLTHRSSAAWNLLAGGLSLTGLLGALLLILTGRTTRVEREVSQRTLEVRLRQAETERLLSQVKKINQDLNDFAHIVSHDLKAPLRGISALAHWIAEDNAERMSAEGKERLEMLKQRVRKMAEMIDGILQYSRVGRVSEALEDVELAALVPAVVDMLAPPPGIHIELQPGLPLVRGTGMRLQQVFQNLIGNAVKYMGKAEGRVSVTFSEYGGWWRFTVEDDGPGIEERFFEKIFQIFQTVGLKDRAESTGVGLSIVKKIVEAAGGRVWVESKLGTGSRFHFTWPRRPVCVGEVPTAEAAAV